jgi:hypothetical protein
VRGHSRRRSAQQVEELLSTANPHCHHQQNPASRSRAASQTRRRDSVYRGHHARLPRDHTDGTGQPGGPRRQYWMSDSESEFRKEKPHGRHHHHEISPPGPERRRCPSTAAVAAAAVARNDPPPAKGQPGGPPLSLAHEIAFVVVIASAQMLMLSGVSMTLIPATVIGESFQLRSASQLSWFSAAYALTSDTFVLPAGRLGDLFGHKRVFVLGFFWVALASLACGFALRVDDAAGGGGGGGNGVVYF